MPWQEGQALPYDGWYGGRVDMMMSNGTYADYRTKLIRRVEKGFFGTKGTIPERIEEGRKLLAKWDAEWEKIPVEERMKLRNVVADDVEIKEKIVYTARGPMKVMRSQPSRNNNMDPRKRQVLKEKKKIRPAGYVTKSSSPDMVSIGKETPAHQSTSDGANSTDQSLVPGDVA